MIGQGEKRTGNKAFHVNQLLKKKTAIFT